MYKGCFKTVVELTGEHRMSVITREHSMSVRRLFVEVHVYSTAEAEKRGMRREQVYAACLLLF